MSMHTGGRVILIAASAILAMFTVACGDLAGPAPYVSIEDDSLEFAYQIQCEASIEAGVICDSAAGSQGADVLSGGHLNFGSDAYVQLSQHSHTWSEADSLLVSYVFVTNKVAQPIGTHDGQSLHVDGIRVFFSTEPSGRVEIVNETGRATFSSGDQPYFQYDHVLARDEASDTLGWQFDFKGETSFTFTVWVNAQIPAPQGVLFWTSIPTTTSQIPVGTLQAIWGFSPSSIFVGGTGGHVSHWNGSSWTLYSNVMTTSINGIWGVSATDLWVVGDGHSIRRFNGSTWSSVALPAEWTTVYNLHAVTGTSADDVWIAAGGGWHYHFNGETWSRVRASGATDNERDVYDIRVVDGNIWSTGFRAFVYEKVGSGFAERCNAALGLTRAARGIWGTDANNIWVVGGTGWVARFNGTACSNQNAASAELRGVWGTSNNDVVAAGLSGTIVHFNGTHWVSHSNPGGSTGLQAVWSSGPDNYYVVGASRTLMRGTRVPVSSMAN